MAMKNATIVMHHIFLIHGRLEVLMQMQEDLALFKVMYLLTGLTGTSYQK